MSGKGLKVGKKATFGHFSALFRGFCTIAVNTEGNYVFRCITFFLWLVGYRYEIFDVFESLLWEK
jgi:hypothetical protein